MKYYLKKCGHQELGSVINGRPQRGRYLLTSMHTLDFFPPLSETQLNDSALLPVIPLYSGKKVYCSYVYHNDKFHGSTAAHPRNEYRIYLNKELEGNHLLFEVGDIVIIRPEEIEEDSETQTVYFLDLIKDRESALYQDLDYKTETSAIRGAYAVYDGRIDEFEHKVDAIRSGPETEIVIDTSVTARIEHTDNDAVAGLFNAVSFRDFVMVGYESLCAVTGTVIRHESYLNLEAAHIKPKSHGGLFMPNNGLALCRDIHWAFDKGFFTLNDDFTVKVHPNTTSEWLRSFDGKQIMLPKDQFFRPSIENIQYHRENVYGLFLKSGRL